jgi:hypothetical protein
MSYLDLTPEDIDVAQAELDVPHHKLGQWVYFSAYETDSSALRLWLEMMWLEAVRPHSIF